MRHIAYALGALTLLAGGGAMAALATPPGGPHTPVTICHKPGTPAEQTLVVDDDAVPGHLGHGDYLGQCEGNETTPTDTTPTDTTPTETTPTTPTPPGGGHDCVYTGAGKDGQPGNDDCAITTTTTTTPAPASPPPAIVPAAAPPTVTVTVPSPPTIITKTKVKLKTRVVVRHHTRIIHKTVVKKIKVCAAGTRLYRGTCHALIQGSG